MTPLACTGAQPQDKGKGDKGAMHSRRHHCWPLRTFHERTDRQAQAHPWSAQGATGRVHTTTGQQPPQRLAPPAMRPFPALVPDCRATAHAKGQTDLSMRFDGTP